jgi:DNA topoisomerase-6 subunit B
VDHSINKDPRLGATVSDNNANTNDSLDESKNPITEKKSIIDVEEEIEGEVEEIKPIKVKKKAKTKARDSKARTASAAVFFNDNRSIAGFGNSMRAVFTAVRELVENSLDASEKRGTTPIIDIKLRRLKKKELIELMGTSVVKSKDTRLDFIELSCKDNGIGVARDLIPQLFGTVLAGTKYGAQQTRGRFGLGSKMVLLYAMSTLDLPIQITTRPESSPSTHRVKLFIDLEKNAPILVSDEVFDETHEEYFNDSGTEIKVSFTGSWNLAKTYVREYFRQLAIITPYADIRVQLPGDEAGTTDTVLFQRVVDEMPKPPEVVRTHPWGTDISAFRREVSNSTEENLTEFLANNFMGVSESAAEEFFEVVGVDPQKDPKELTSPEIRRIVHDGFTRALKESKTVKKKFRVFKFDDPKGDALSPLGADRLRKGLEKELEPDFVEARTREPRAYEGHPFVIEAAIGYGGGVSKATASKGVTVVDNRVIYRYANRIPLIFGAGSDLITNVANSINWSNYGLTRGTEPLAIAVSLVSTKIPFPETSKEYIDKVEEIGTEVKLALEELGRKLKRHLGRTRRRQRERQRKSRFEKYAPKTVENLLTILKEENIWNPTTGVSESRIITALSSGTPRIDSTVIPPGEPIFRAPIWGNTKTQQKLQTKNIHEVSTFLKTPNKKLAKILAKTVYDVDTIKRRTINELDLAGEIPNIDASVILDTDIEKRFHQRVETGKSIELPRLSKAFFRRWIRNSYDYLVSPPDKLAKVQGLTTKLVEAERFDVIKRLFETISETDLLNELSSFLGSGAFGEFDISTTDQDPITVSFLEDSKLLDFFGDDVKGVTTEEKVEGKEEGPLEINLSEHFPPLDDLYTSEQLKKRKISSILEFLLETAHPSVPIDEKVIAPLLIPHFKMSMLGLIAVNPNYKDIKIDVTGQKWVSGYLRNAFKRRKISTVMDLINTEDSVLLEIGELQRTLFSGLMKTLVIDAGEIKLNEYNSTNAEQKIELLKASGINTLEQFAFTSSVEFATDPKYWKFVALLIEESKEKIIENLTLQNKLGSLPLLKEITPELENELYGKGISSSYDLIIKPIDDFDSSFQKRISIAKSKLGRNFDGFLKKHKDAFKVSGITVLEELIFNPDHYLNKDVPESTKENLLDALEYLMLPAALISPNLIGTVNVLREAGVTTVGKFLIWPGKELSQITDMTEEWLNLIRESFSITDLKADQKKASPLLTSISHLLPDEYITHLSNLGIQNIPQAAQIRWGDIFPKINDTWKQLAEINAILIDDLSKIKDHIIDKKMKRGLPKIFEELASQPERSSQINTLLQLIKKPYSSVSQSLKTAGKRKTIKELMQDMVSLTPKLLDKESIYYKAIMTYQVLELIKSPIVYLSEFDNREIELLNAEGIKTLNQIYCLNIKEIASILGTTHKIIKLKLENSSLLSHGTPLTTVDEKGKYQSIVTFEREGINYFSSEEISNLMKSGYDTLESLYYMSDHRTFEVKELNWEVVNQFKKLLRSPPVLITWKKIIQEEIKEDPEQHPSKETLFGIQPAQEEEPSKVETKEAEPKYRDVVYYETFTSKELEILTKSNITRVLDFITYPMEELSKLLDWDVPLTSTRQSTIILQEAGIELSDLGIFRQAHLDHLSEIGMLTIEDLYFTANVDTWDSTILPWEPIGTIKQIVHLHLTNAVEELSQDIVDILVVNGVETILDLLLTGDPILEQKTGLPAERFENVKYALDFGELIETFDKSVLFTPELNFFQIKKLLDAGYTRILDIVLANHIDISKVLEVPAPYATQLLEQISRTSIQKAEEDRGVLLKDINAFSRSDQRSIARSGIFEMNTLDTLQEVLYQITPEIFQGEEYLLNSVLSLQKICKIPLNQIGDLIPSEVDLLQKHRIHTIADVLIIGYDDLEAKHDLHTTLSNVTNYILDLRPFLALAQLPTQAVMQSGEDENPLIDTWLSNGKMLHQRTMSNIRSLLSIPIKLTSFAKKYEGEVEELADKTVADILLEYIPDEEHPDAKLKMRLKRQGSIIKLLKEGSTPISLLDLDPLAYRALSNNGITTIERLMLNDEKYLATLTGTTQKYWKIIKDLFDPEVFNARMGDIGLSIKLLPLSGAEQALLDELGIEYLDQVTVFDDAEDILHDLKQYLTSSSIFLSGSPGEREISLDAGAHNVIETILALRKQGANADLIAEATTLGWQAYKTNKLAIPKSHAKKCEKEGIFSIQDLVTHVQISSNGKIPKSWSELAEPYLESPLLLPLPSNELQEIVKVHRCTNVIEALTSPMTIGKISKIKTDVQSGNPPPLLYDLKLPIDIIKKISAPVWRRIAERGLNLQEIISSPRTLAEYKNLKQQHLQATRDCLRIPLSRTFIGGKQVLKDIGLSKQYHRLDDLIFSLPQQYQKEPELTNLIIKVINSEDLSIISEPEILPELQMSAETALGVSIHGFHEFWTATSQAHNILSKIETKPAMALKTYIINSSYSIESIEEITPAELWKLIKLDICTLSDLILNPDALIIAKSDLTKKRVSQLQSMALDSINKGPSDSSLTLNSITEKLDVYTDELLTISLLSGMQTNPHPLLVNRNIPSSLETKLQTPFIMTGVADKLEINELKLMLKQGIYTVSDFLLFPKELNILPDSIRNIEDRLDALSSLFVSNREDMKISELKLPVGITSKISHISHLSELIDFVLTVNDEEINKILFIKLRYSGLESDRINKLEENNISTVFDLIIASPEAVSDFIDLSVEWILEFIKQIDFAEIERELDDVPLKIDEIDKITDRSRSLIKSVQIQTLLDLEQLAEIGISRVDENYLRSLLQILDAPYEIIRVEHELSINDKKIADEYNITKLTDLIRLRASFDKSLNTKLSSLTHQQLVDIKSKQRKLSDLEEIGVKEETILNKVGIFHFNQLLAADSQYLIKSGLKEDKVENIKEVLDSSWKNIIGFEDDQIIENYDIKTIADLLSMTQITLQAPIRVQKEIKLVNLFVELPKIVGKQNLTSLKDFLSSKEMITSFKSNTEIQSVVAALHTWIGHIPKIPSGWISKLEGSQIFRVWQYLLEDPNQLAKICSSSVKAQGDFQGQISLTHLHPRELELPFVSNEIKDLLISNGIFTLQELLSDGFLSTFISTYPELGSQIDRYKEVLGLDVWKLEPYWNFSESERTDISKIGSKIHDLAKINDPHVNLLLLAGLKDETLDVHPLEPWITDQAELSKLRELGIISLESWFFNKTKGIITSDQISNIIFRSTLDVIPEITPKQIISGFRNGITHISDLLLEDPVNLAKKLGTSKSKVESVLGSISTIEMPREKLASIGLFSPQIIEILSTSGIYSWSQLIGNILQEEIESIKGITWKSILSFRETTKIPLWYSLELRNQGLRTMLKLSKIGVQTIDEMLMLGSRLVSIIGDQVQVDKILSSLTRANLNKGKKHSDTKLSLSAKLKASAIPEFNKAGIHSPLDILLETYSIKKDSPLLEAVNDWIRLGELPIDSIDFPDKVIKALEANNVNFVKQVMMVPDSLLRNAGATNNQIKEFRKTLKRKKGWKPTKTKATTKKAPRKKVTTKKAPPKKAPPEKVTTKKAPPKKVTTKKATPKKAPPKKATTKKAPPKKVTTKKATMKKAVTIKKPASKRKTPTKKKSSSKKKPTKKGSKKRKTTRR